MHQAVFAFVALAGVLAGTALKKDIGFDENARRFLVFCITQMEFFVALFVTSLVACQNVHAGYIRAIEKRINELCGETVNIWESKICDRFIQRPRGCQAPIL